RTRSPSWRPRTRRWSRRPPRAASPPGASNPCASPLFLFGLEVADRLGLERELGEQPLQLRLVLCLVDRVLLQPQRRDLLIDRVLLVAELLHLRVGKIDGERAFGAAGAEEQRRGQPALAAVLHHGVLGEEQAFLLE